MFRPRFFILGLSLLTLLLYAPLVRNGFINYDDPDYITENRVVQNGITLTGLHWAFTTFHANNWHPLTWLSHMTDCELFGLDAGAHHMVSALIHAANAGLVLLLLYRLAGALWPAAFAAALFAFHPLHVQSVAWASERKDVLSTFFGLLAVLAYLKSLRVRQAQSSSRLWSSRHYWGAVLLFALSLMTKPMWVTLPCILLLLDFWPLHRVAADQPLAKRWRELALEKWPFFVLTLVSCVVTFLAQRAEAVIAMEPFPLQMRLANAALAYCHYLVKMLWPVKLALIYPLSPHVSGILVVLSTIVLATITLVCWMQRQARPHLLIGWLWYVGTLVPVIGLVQVGGQAMADRYTYLPLIGIFFAIAIEMETFAACSTFWSKLWPAAATCILLACAVGTLMQMQFWSDSETLFRRALAVTSRNATAHVNLGTALENAGRRTEALEQYRQAVDINPSLAQAHNNLANLLDEAGKPDEALKHYEQALQLKPRAALVRANFGGLLARMGRWEEAQKQLQQAASLAPADPRPPYVAGKSLLRAGRNLEALGAFREALRRDPSNLQALTFAARALAASQDPKARNGPEAVSLAERAAALTGGQDAFVLDTLAMAYAEAGNFAGALKAIEKAIELGRRSGDLESVRQMESRQQLYRAGKAYREPAG